MSRGSSSGTLKVDLRIHGTEAELDCWVAATSVANRRCPKPVIDSQPDYGSFVTCSADEQTLKGKVDNGLIRLDCSAEQSDPSSNIRSTHRYVSKGFVSVAGYDVSFLSAMLQAGRSEP